MSNVIMISSWQRMILVVLVPILVVLFHHGGVPVGYVVASSLPSQFAAMFVFGDSIIDNGNNNMLNSWAKANYVPYGMDFNQGRPTGRFSNGKTSIDCLGDLLGLPYIPAFANPSSTGKAILRGVNYASAAAGILEETGQDLGERFNLRQQVDNFENYTLNNDLRKQIEDENELSQYLSNSLVIMVIGSNDYINNYFLPGLYPTSFIYNPSDYANLLINRYTTQILRLYSLGLRKFVLAGVGPLGCIPNQLATGLVVPGKCVTVVNNAVEMFNSRLRSVVEQLNFKYYPESVFTYGNTFGAFTDILDNPSLYGFKVTDRGCCGVGRNRGQITCLPLSIPCANRSEFVFWDAFHPTEAMSQVLARKAYDGPPSDCYPVNIHQMAQSIQ